MVFGSRFKNSVNMKSLVECKTNSPVSRHIVLMRTNVIHLLNRVPEHDSLRAGPSFPKASLAYVAR